MIQRKLPDGERALVEHREGSGSRTRDEGDSNSGEGESLHSES